ncbi:hypothetical protein [Actinoalloteichus fjordicus]|uniref:Uncharacterized protein n=1 Tax=Actinoalloteichus fjordicus TaxID=1612552 RepID=A0AAC9LB42_9PSEU|nr:hypothetical protein [Actinoalloteichus fjordicus]APU14518.1 hypothetical protein UA74_12290 [Actinoalloteichus fjordicus]
MNDDFDLPPRRELPQEVRDRMRFRLRQGLEGAGSAQSRASRLRAPVLVAASVGLLAMAAVVTTNVLAGDADGPAGPAPSGESEASEVPVGDEPFDRCGAAVAEAGAGEQFPDPGSWTVSKTLFDGQVLEIEAADQRFFCHVTARWAHVSDPAAAVAEPTDDRPVASIEVTATGSILGRVPADYGGEFPYGLYFEVRDGQGTLTVDVVVEDGVFFAPMHGDQTFAEDYLPSAEFYRTGPAPEYQQIPLGDLPPVAPFLVAVEDRPDAVEEWEQERDPGPDAPGGPEDEEWASTAPGQGVAENEWLRQCLEDSASTSPQSWRAGPAFSVYPESGAVPRILVARTRAAMGMCWLNAATPGPGATSSLWAAKHLPEDVTETTPVMAEFVEGGEAQAVWGVVPEEVSRLVIVVSGGAEVDALIEAGMYAARLPEDSAREGDTASFRAYDAAGALIDEQEFLLEW